MKGHPILIGPNTAFVGQNPCIKPCLPWDLEQLQHGSKPHRTPALRTPKVDDVAWTQVMNHLHQANHNCDGPLSLGLDAG